MVNDVGGLLRGHLSGADVDFGMLGTLVRCVHSREVG